jgi:histidinol-phosphatase (PHP family)
LLPDLHIHTPYCQHAKGTMDETVLKAIDMGLPEIGFTGHMPYPPGFVEPAPDCVIPENLYPDYLKEVEALQSRYGSRIRINLAVEIDYFDRYAAWTGEQVRKQPYDYIIGSMHIVDGVALDYEENVLKADLDKLGGVDGLWERYYQTMEKLIRSELCQIVGHFDLPKKFSITQTRKDFTDYIVYLLELIRENNLVVEINTGGKDRSFPKEFYPSNTILELARDKHVDITLGSDAHAPEDVGRYFVEATELLRSLGWKTVAVFRNREKAYLKIP